MQRLKSMLQEESKEMGITESDITQLQVVIQGDKI